VERRAPSWAWQKGPYICKSTRLQENLYPTPFSKESEINCTSWIVNTEWKNRYCMKRGSILVSRFHQLFLLWQCDDFVSQSWRKASEIWKPTHPLCTILVLVCMNIFLGKGNLSPIHLMVSKLAAMTTYLDIHQLATDGCKYVYNILFKIQGKQLYQTFVLSFYRISRRKGKIQSWHWLALKQH
jgi:hypothetical protein